MTGNFFSLKNKMIISVGILSMIIMFVSVYSILKLHHLNSILQKTSYSAGDINRLIEGLSEMDNLQLNKTLEGAIGFENDRNNIAIYREVFKKYREIAKSSYKELISPSDDLNRKIEKVYQDISDGKTLDAVDFQRKTVKPSVDMLNARLKLLKEDESARINTINEDALKNVRQSSVLLIAFTICSFVISAFVIVMIKLTISPISRIVQRLRMVSEGDLSENTGDFKSDMDRKDEIGTLALATRYLIDTANETVRTAEAIAYGNLKIKVRERSEHDRLMQALNMMIRSLNAIMSETDAMIRAVGEGRLDVRGNADAFKGGWRELVVGVNRLIDGLSSAVSEKAALGTEMELAKKIQTVLLPKKPEITGYEIAATCEPADEVGGDYYDVISVGGFDWIVIGDVSGHGVTSGLVMMMVQTAIHTVLIQNPEVPPSELLWVINRVIYENISRMDEQKHMTIIMIACGKDGFFNFSGLHEDILLRCSVTEKVEKIETDGMWIGLEADISDMLPITEFRLCPGDCIVLYTDGIIEAIGQDGKFFGIERLSEIVEKSGGRPASEVHAAIIEALKPYEKPDDVTLFVMKRI